MTYKRGGVYWYKFRWTITNAEGKHENYMIRKSARTSNVKRARDVEEEHRRALRMGEIHPADSWPKVEQQAPEIPSLRVFSEQFKGFAKLHTKAGTAKFYSDAIVRVLRFPTLADAQLSEVNSELVGKYAQWRKSTNPDESVLTINGELRTIRRMVNVAHEWGIIPNRPIIHELPGGKGRERVITFSEEARYVAAASSTVRELAMLAADTGMRPNSELFPLEWFNVRLEATQDAPLGFIHVKQGKTDAATRNIPLTPRTREMLLAKKQLAKQGARFVFPGPGNSGHITTVQHAHERTIKRANKGVKEEQQIEAFEFYCWRHTFGTRCAESGMDKFSLARLMGHSSPRVAERYYIHVSESHVMTGFERFVTYQTAGVIEAVKQLSNSIQ
jgi:integrase